MSKKAVIEVFIKDGNATSQLVKLNQSYRRESKLTNEQVQRDQNGTIKNLILQTSKVKNSFTNLSGRTLGALGLGYGLGSLISQSKGFIDQIGRVGDELTGLSDQFGSVNKAVGIYYSGLGSSFASMAQVKGAMQALGNEGIKVSQAGFKELTFAVADFSQITGISADTVANLAGAIKGFGMANAADMKALLNSVVSIGLNGPQATQVIQQIQKSVENLAGFAKDANASIKGLSKGISEATAFMGKFGIRTGMAVQFLDKLTDPEQYGEVAGLLNRMNISQADYFSMLESASGKANFFEKLQNNLPAIADQIQAISNPIARLNFAKSLGVPMEVAAKLAGKTRAEIQGAIKDSLTNQQALAKKQEQAKANQERFNEKMEMFRMQALMPLMDFMMKNMGNFMKLMSLISKFLNLVLTGITNYLGKFQGAIDKVFNAKTLGEFMQLAFTELVAAMPKLITDIAGGVWTAITAGFKFGIETFLKLPFWAQLFVGTMAFVKLAQFTQGIKAALGMGRGSKLNPMYVISADGSDGGVTSRVGRFIKKTRVGRALGRFGGRIGKAATALGRSIVSNAGAAGNVAKGLGQAALPALNKFAKFIPFIGTLASIAGGVAVIALAKTPEETKKEAIRQAKILGGMAIGAAIGSAIPVLGTAVGGLIGTVAGTVAAYWDDINNSIGNFIGIQKLFGKGLDDEEEKEKKRLEAQNKKTKLIGYEAARLNYLNTIQERVTKSSFTDNLGSIIGKIAGFFGADGARIAAKAQLFFDNLKTMFISVFNNLGTFLNPLNALALAEITFKEQYRNAYEKMNKDFSVAVDRGNAQEMRGLAAKFRAQQSVTDNKALKDMLGTKAQELEMRAQDTDVYFRKVKALDDAEKKKQHAETMKALGGIGANTAKTAENTSPQRNPVVDAFKALSRTEMMETQFAGSNFVKK